jgi:hypothetical protein
MAGETPLMPCVPELPARGPGADMVGRTLSLLSMIAPEFAAQTSTTGWRLAGRLTDGSSRDMSRANSWLREDLDVSEEGFGEARSVKCAVAGPWTLAATVELPNGHRILSDPGAIRDLVAAFSQSVVELVGLLRRRFPNSGVILQIDEPALPAVVGGGIATISGLDRYRAVSAEVARSGLSAAVVAAHGMAAGVVLHCCALPAPIGLLRSTGADALSLDLVGRSGPDGVQDEEELGALLESTCGVMAGVVAPWQLDVTAGVRRLLELLARLGIALPTVLPRLAVSHPCGLAGESPDVARAAVRSLAEVAATIQREVS